MSEYNLGNMDTQENFDDLMKGSFELAQKNGLMGDFRSIMSAYDWAEQVKPMVFASGMVPIYTLTSQVMGDNPLVRVVGEVFGPSNGYVPIEVHLTATEIITEVPVISAERPCYCSKAIGRRILRAKAGTLLEAKRSEFNGKYVEPGTPVEDGMTTRCTHPACSN